jgi:hypothetical protein
VRGNDIELVDRSKFVDGGALGLDIYTPNKLPVNFSKISSRIYIGYPPLAIVSIGDDLDYPNNCSRQAVEIIGMGFQPGAIANFEKNVGDQIKIPWILLKFRQIQQKSLDTLMCGMWHRQHSM